MNEVFSVSANAHGSGLKPPVKEPDRLSLVFYVPLAELAASDPRVRSHPASEEGSLSWRAEKDRWLAGIAEVFHRRRSFSLGLIGFQVSGQYSASDLIPDDRPPAPVADHPPTTQDVGSNFDIAKGDDGWLWPVSKNGKIKFKTTYRAP